MLPAKILQDYEKLPNEAQRQVIDFIKLLKARYQNPEKDTESIERSFGLLTASHSV